MSKQEKKMSLVEKIKCRLDFHEYEKKKRGLFQYQKGAREKLTFYGTLFKCSKCGKEKFVNEDFPVKSKKKSVKLKVSEIN